MSVCNPPTKTQFSVPPPDMPAARQLHSKLWPPDGKCAFQIVSCKLQALEGRENKRGPGCLEEGWKVWGHAHFQSQHSQPRRVKVALPVAQVTRFWGGAPWRSRSLQVVAV